MSQKNIVIVGKGQNYLKNDKVPEKLNNFFIKLVENLEIKPFSPKQII